MDRGKQQPIKLSIETVPRTWWKISTPAGRGDEFHTDWLTSDERDRLKLDWRTDPRRDGRWFETRLVQNGGNLTWDEREQEHNCSFAGVSGVRIWKVDRGQVVYTDRDLSDEVRAQSFLLGSMDFGSGPSWTVCLLALIVWDDEGRPSLWFDREFVRQRVAAHEIGAEIIEVVRTNYRQNHWFVGDPAGRNKESDQESWESNLQRAGLPLRCLPPEYNTPHMIDSTIREVQILLDAGQIRVHSRRCPVLLSAIESWEYDLPRGVPLELVSRETLKPKKNIWSHPGDALRYGVGAVLRSRPRLRIEDLNLSKLPKGPAGEVAEVFERILGPYLG